LDLRIDIGRFDYEYTTVRGYGIRGNKAANLENSHEFCDRQDNIFYNLHAPRHPVCFQVLVNFTHLPGERLGTKFVLWHE